MKLMVSHLNEFFPGGIRVVVGELVLVGSVEDLTTQTDLKIPEVFFGREGM